jgi:hypothetical protein
LWSARVGLKGCLTGRSGAASGGQPNLKNNTVHTAKTNGAWPISSGNSLATQKNFANENLVIELGIAKATENLQSGADRRTDRPINCVSLLGTYLPIQSSNHQTSAYNRTPVGSKANTQDKIG